MPNKTEIITIEIPSDIPEAIKEADHISDNIKAQMGRRVIEGMATIHKNKKDPDMDSKCGAVLDVLQERSKDKGHITKSELIDMLEISEKEFSPFMMRFNKYARERSIKISKSKSKGRTVYKIK
jgi:hypothetical protein